MDESRRKRLSAGSGVDYMIVCELLENFKRTKRLIENFSKMKVGKSDNLSEMMRNPNQLKNQLSKAMDPRMLQQVGGMDNIMNMMKRNFFNFLGTVTTNLIFFK